VVAVPLGEFDGLARPVAQVIELGAPGFAASNRLDIEHIGRMQRKNPLDSLVGDYPPNGEVLVNTPAFAGDYSAGKDLRSLFVALSDPAMDLDDIAYLEVRDLALKTFAFNSI